MAVEALKALIQKLIETRENEIQELKTFLASLNEMPKEIIETPEAEFLHKGDTLYARLLRKQGEISIFPVESLQIKADDMAIKWLQKKVFEKAALKHGFKFEFLNRNGLLSTIRIHGLKDEHEIEKLLNATTWALEKASSR